MADRGRLSIGNCIKTVLLFFNETKVGCLHKDKLYDHPHLKQYMNLTTNVRTP